MFALEVQTQLIALKAERALAAVEGLDHVGAYMTELDYEIAALQSAYVRAAVTEIATFRAEMSGAQVG